MVQVDLLGINEGRSYKKSGRQVAYLSTKGFTVEISWCGPYVLVLFAQNWQYSTALIFFVIILIQLFCVLCDHKLYRIGRFFD